MSKQASAAALAGMLIHGAASAQAPAPAAPASAAATQRIEIVGSAERETANGTLRGYAARRSATATKTDTPLNEVPQSISVIGAEQLRDQASPNLQEALRYSPGVRTETYGVDNRGDWFSLRGGSNGSTLIDGLRRPTTGYWGIVRNDPYAFERIEVLRGPASLIAGQNGPGGVVNLVSKRPQAEAAGEIGIQLGNHRHRQVQLDLTGPVDDDGKLLYRLVSLVKRSDTQVQHAFDERELFAPSLTWRPNAGTSLTVFAQVQRDESGNLNAFFPAAGTLLPAPNGPIPTQTFIGEPDWDTYGGNRVRAGWQFEQRLSEAWTLRQSLRHDRTDGKMRTMYAEWWTGFADASGAADPNGRYLNRWYYAADDKDGITNADLLFEGRLRTGSAKHTLLLGADGMRSRARQRYHGDFLATPLDVYNPLYGSFPLPPLPDTPTVVTSVRRQGVLVQDQIKFDDRFVLVAGLRRDTAQTTVDGGAAVKDAATSRNLGAVWLADGGWSPYVGYSESFEPVAPANGRQFKPQRGKQIEAGVKWQPAESRLTASAAVYELREENRLTTDPTNPSFSTQLGEVTVKGLEFEIAGQVAAWDLTAQYSYTDAYVSRSLDASQLGHQLEAIPKHSAGLWAVHRLAAVPGLRAGAGLRHVGESSDGKSGLPVPAVNLLDAMLSYDIDAWRLALNVNNLTDKSYVASCLGRGDCWYGQRRRAVATVSYRW